jgi:7,8-dihydropterin-6-yl-methyl-4-(beta-D-ribofuranosyl)aminobenzene 5'-phosphate synthase
LALWIQADNYHILFDTGLSDVLIHNAEVLGIDLSTVDAMILSHGHYDHTGGIQAVLNLKPDVSIYSHPNIFMPRYSRQADGAMKPVGVNAQASIALHSAEDTIHWTSGSTLIAADVGITGPIPRISPLEDTGGAFFLDTDAKKPDPIEDDLALWFKTAAGLVIVTGCCHSGVINTIEYIRAHSGDVPVHALIGGFHLLHVSTERIGATCDYLQKIGVRLLVPCHCTGENAVRFLAERFGQKLFLGSIGSCFIF